MYDQFYEKFLDSPIVGLSDMSSPSIESNGNNEFQSQMDNCFDLSSPHNQFPSARLMKRKIIFHGGPTNSGKTYHALKRLEKSNNGLYCGPLRLLALEIYDKLNKNGIVCNLRFPFFCCFAHDFEVHN